MKKPLIKNTMHLARVMTYLEAGKAQVTIGNSREYQSKLEKFDLLCQEAGYESPLYAIYKKNRAKIMAKGARKNAKSRLAGLMSGGK